MAIRTYELNLSVFNAVIMTHTQIHARVLKHIKCYLASGIFTILTDDFSESKEIRIKVVIIRLKSDNFLSYTVQNSGS